MSKTREIQCQYYLNEGNCSKGRSGTFRKQCQTCNLYSHKIGGKPARPNLKRKKLDDIRKREERQ